MKPLLPTFSVVDLQVMWAWGNFFLIISVFSYHQRELCWSLCRVTQIFIFRFSHKSFQDSRLNYSWKGSIFCVSCFQFSDAKIWVKNWPGVDFMQRLKLVPGWEDLPSEDRFLSHSLSLGKTPTPKCLYHDHHCNHRYLTLKLPVAWAPSYMYRWSLQSMWSRGNWVTIIMAIVMIIMMSLVLMLVITAKKFLITQVLSSPDLQCCCTGYHI